MMLRRYHRSPKESVEQVPDPVEVLKEQSEKVIEGAPVIEVPLPKKQQKKTSE